MSSTALPQLAEVDTVEETVTIDGEPFPYPILRGEGGIVVRAESGNIPMIIVAIPVVSVTTHC